MSAFVCHHDTFDLLATAYQQFASHRSDSDLPTADVATILRDENIRSVRARYPDANLADECGVESYRYRPVTDRIDPIVVLKSIACLDYQSCETDDWPTTRAYRLLETIKDRAIWRLPGMDAAPWGWTRPDLPAPTSAARTATVDHEDLL